MFPGNKAAIQHAAQESQNKMKLKGKKEPPGTQGFGGLVFFPIVSIFTFVPLYIDPYNIKQTKK